MHRKRSVILSAVVALFTLPFFAGIGTARIDPNGGGDGIVNTKGEVYRESHQHGPSSGHLPPTQENVALVGEKKLTNTPDRISDVAVLGDYAYLGRWAAGLTTPACRGGVDVVDISNPSKPEKVNHLPSHAQTYATEGVQTLHVETAAFTGDLLVVSNESCGPRGIGGFTLWDVTDPLNPVKLSEDGGDYTNGDTIEDPGAPVVPVAHEAHSAFAWQDGEDVYLIAIDNNEALDLDFFEITDPANPVLLSETGLQDWPTVEIDAFGDFPTAHDFDVRNIPDMGWTALVSYWDAGWVFLDVNDLEAGDPPLIDDTDYEDCEATVGSGDVSDDSCPPEGNAHQAEWNEAGGLFIGTDEDSSPFRSFPMEVTEQTAGGVPGQPAVGTEYGAGEFGWTIPIATLPDEKLNGPMVFGGYGCDEDASDIPPASVLDPFIDDPSEESILVVQRGPVGDPSAPFEACFFSIKVENAQDAGYDAVIIANHHTGAALGAQPDAFFCGGQGHAFTITARGVCTGHRAMHELFGTTPSYAGNYAGEDAPAPGDIGPKIEMISFFDSWGHARLFEADPTGGFTEIDQLFLEEQTDLDFAVGFGDLTVHEVATGVGPDAGFAYFSWYSAGFRVAEFDETGITEVGAFIDQGGNDLWGVQLTDKFTASGDRIVAVSDRDFGLYLLAYTG